MPQFHSFSNSPTFYTIPRDGVSRQRGLGIQNSFFEFIGTEIDFYFENNTDQTSAAVRWEAFKAFLRGHMVRFTSFIHKSHRLEMEQLEKSIK